MKTKIVYSEKCLGYGTWHVEGPQRVKIAHDILQQKGYEFVEPQPATEDQILSVHDMEYIWNLKKGLVEDSDTPAYDKIFDYAQLSVGGALLASQIGGFSLMRPPGHHVGRYGAALGVYTRGFCYLNNIAIAVKESKKKTLILDIDGHHGNGTQEIFLGDDQVTFISLHQSPNFPGTGCNSETNCINYPLPATVGGKVYIEVLNKVLKSVDLGKFEALAVSAGFDTHKGDLATLSLVEQDFFEIGKVIGKLGLPTFFVFEGGYHGHNVGTDIDMFLRGYEENR
ncbi:MAG: histone deacetylase family protein [Candidatus Bathyarchaeia archaeon]|jgi:acetoin utilization deacetylase AcuC-like enzyme